MILIMRLTDLRMLIRKLGTHLEPTFFGLLLLEHLTGSFANPDKATQQQFFEGKTTREIIPNKTSLKQEFVVVHDALGQFMQILGCLV